MIVLEANYAKKLGLPWYSSHQYSVSIRTELTDLSQVEAESARLYELLQQSVDRQMQSTGFVPDEAYGVAPQHGATRNGSPNGHPRNGNGNGTNGHHRPANGLDDRWNCTDGQRGFILRILEENQIPKTDAEDLANQMFGVGVKQMNKMQASQLIEELLAKASKPSRPNRWRQPAATQTSTPAAA